MSDCASVQKAYMNSLENKWMLPYSRIPFTDPPHDIKGVRRFLFWYWLDLDGFLVNLRLFSDIWSDPDQTISAPVKESLSRECLRSRDMMSVETATPIFRPKVKSAVPERLVATTLIPELHKYWRQNTPGIIECPNGIIFHSRYSMCFICDRAKSELFMSNMHSPVCVSVVATSKQGLKEPMGLS